MEVYVVTDSNGYVQPYFTWASARADIVDALKDHAARYDYSDEELNAAIQDLDEEFALAVGHVPCGTYLGEYEISCTKSTIKK